MRPFLFFSFAALLVMGYGALSLPTQAGSDQDSAAPRGPAERRQVLSELASDLEANCPSPELGGRYASMLRSNLADGAYDRVTDPTEFGEKVTQDLQSVSPDRHLRIGLKDAFERPRRFPADAPASTRPSGPAGLEEAKMFGDVAYLRFNLFPDEPPSAEQARSFLLAHAAAKAVIIDSRPNRGGGLTVMNAILPLLYAEKAVQVRMDRRASTEAVLAPEEDPTLVRQPSPATVVSYDHVIEPDAHETRLQHVPVYYLTSRRTASAAEHLAMAFKRNHRATLIGETTAGANHFGETMPLGERFLAFIPQGRSYDPATGEDWEGRGIAPDKQVPADEALNEALAEAKAAGATPDR